MSIYGAKFADEVGLGQGEGAGLMLAVWLRLVLAPAVLCMLLLLSMVWPTRPDVESVLRKTCITQCEKELGNDLLYCGSVVLLVRVLMAAPSSAGGETALAGSCVQCQWLATHPIHPLFACLAACRVRATCPVQNFKCESSAAPAAGRPTGTIPHCFGCTGDCMQSARREWISQRGWVWPRQNLMGRYCGSLHQYAAQSAST